MRLRALSILWCWPACRCWRRRRERSRILRVARGIDRVSVQPASLRIGRKSGRRRTISSRSIHPCAAAFDKMLLGSQGRVLPMIMGRYMAFKALVLNRDLQELKIVQMKMEITFMACGCSLQRSKTAEMATQTRSSRNWRCMWLARLWSLRMEERAVHRPHGEASAGLAGRTQRGSGS